MKSFLADSKTYESLEFCFNNENIKKLRKINQTEIVNSKIIQLSVEHEILIPYVQLINYYLSQEEKELNQSLINNILEFENEYSSYDWSEPCYARGCIVCCSLFVKTLTGKHINVYFDPTDRVEDLNIQ